MHARAAVLAAFGGLAIGVFSGISAAQTCTGWFPPDPTAGPLGTVNAITTFDPDGEGPLPEWIIFGGRFTVAGDVISPNVVAWDGAQFIPLPGLNGEVWSLKVFDADGGGPLPPRLYAGGSFGQPSSGFSVWNGESWQSTGANFLGQATVFTMEVYDEDGVGPNPPRLFLGGIFSIAPVTSAFNIARFDGTQLSSLPTGWFSGFLQYVHEMEVFDFDADGPEEPRLVLVGTFSFVQTPPLNNLNGIVTWNGQQFASLGSGLGVNNASSAALPAPRGILGFDPDRNGTAPPVLVAGNITPLLWGGTQTGWSPAGAAASWPALSELWQFLPYVRPGETQPVLLAIGGFSINGSPNPLYALSDPLSASTPWSVETSTPLGLRVAAQLDPDGDGARGMELIVGGVDAQFSSSAASLIGTPSVQGWNGETWSTLMDGDIGRIRSGVVFDFDGPGGAPPSLVVAGNVRSLGGAEVSGLAAWNGTWQPLVLPPITGQTLNSVAIRTFDFDGPGSGAQRLLITRMSQTTQEQTTTFFTQTHTWTSNGWEDFAFPVGMPINSIPSDPDGSGPAGDLVVGYEFPSTGIIRFSIWDGENVNVIPALAPTPPGGWLVYDHDADAQTPPRIAYRGSNRTVYEYDGAVWSQLGPQFALNLTSLIACDVDGPGPSPRSLYTTSLIPSPGTGFNLLRWDGIAWVPVAGVFNGSNPFTIRAVDLDGEGPMPEMILALANQNASGGFTAIDGVPFNGAALWNGAEWLPFPGGEGFDAFLGVWDPDGDGPAQGQYAVASPRTSGQSPRAVFARYGNVGEPVITQQPSPLSITRGEDITLSVAVSSTSEASFVWASNGQTLQDGPSAGGGVISGALSANLVITGAGLADEGVYTVTITNPCGGVRSREALVSVGFGCIADFNNDGGVDDLDITAFFAAFELGEPDADVNGDDGIDDLDITEFFAQFELGC